ncbi:stage 0 sporulation protein, partial [Clostridium tertium]|nr:stage 0 sporulation protein [Clostridium tertium]
SIVSMGDTTGEVVSNSTVKESVKVKYRRGDEEVVEEFKIDDIELVEGSYEDSVDESDIKLEIESPEDKKLIKDLIKDN